MDTPLVTVIICVYNAEKYLDDAIQSALKQDYPKIELLIVDDGSTDRSAEIAARHPSVKLIQHPTNLGLPSARNTGIRSSTGEYIAFLDADDLWAPQKISTQIQFHNENRRYKFSFSQEKFFFEDENQKPNWSRKPAFQADHTAYCAGSMIFHRSIFEIVGDFDSALNNGDTTDWVFRAKDMGYQGGMLDQTLLYRRIHTENLSSQIIAEKNNLLRIVKDSINRQRKTNE